MTIPTFFQAYAVQFTKQVAVQEVQTIQKAVQAAALVSGNIGNANADAKAFGPDTLAETLTLTYATNGVGSGAFSESLSATNGSKWIIYT